MSTFRSLAGLLTVTIFAISLNRVAARGHNETDRVVGGYEAKPGEFPFIAALCLADTDKFNCGGAIIDSRHILTAAHCVTKDPDRPAHKLNAKLGCHNRYSCPATYKIEAAVLHPQYRRFGKNDIALLRTSEPIQFKPGNKRGSIDTIEMAESISDDYVPGENVIIAGWGKVKIEGHSEILLRKVTVPTISIKACKRFFGSADENVICAGRDGQGACRGDSGGPVIRKFPDGSQKVVGINSAGKSDCMGPGIKMRVAAYRKWIDNVIRRWKGNEIRSTSDWYSNQYQ